MAYDEKLAERVREKLQKQRGISEKKMFGGIAFFVHGNMCCGVIDKELMVRVGPDGHAEALQQPFARPMDFTGKAMKGMVYVSSDGLKSPQALQSWIERGISFAKSLPAK